MTDSLQDAIARNRARQAVKKSESKPEPALRPYRIRVMVIPTRLDEIMFGTQPKTETRTFMGTSLKGAKERNGIQ